jgi:hypothetical protein
MLLCAGRSLGVLVCVQYLFGDAHGVISNRPARLSARPHAHSVWQGRKSCGKRGGKKRRQGRAGFEG